MESCIGLKKTNFEWDEVKNIQNQNKHKISFDVAQYAFADTKRIIAKNIEHSADEERFYCF